MLTSLERRVLVESRTTVENTKRAVAELKLCVDQSRHLIAQSGSILKSCVHYHPGRVSDEQSTHH